jgi:hypothetical protein
MRIFNLEKFSEMTETPRVSVFSYKMEVARVEPVFWFEEEERAGRFLYNTPESCLGLMADYIQVPLEVSLQGPAAVFAFQLRVLQEISPGDLVVQTHTSRSVRNIYGLWSIRNETNNQIIKAEQLSY